MQNTTEEKFALREVTNLEEVAAVVVDLLEGTVAQAAVGAIEAMAADRLTETKIEENLE